MITKRAVIATVAAFAFFFSSGATGVCNERCPFEEASKVKEEFIVVVEGAPPKPIYNYEKAVAALSLRGILITKGFSNAIFLIDGRHLVTSSGDRLSVNVGGLNHIFEVKRIERDGVILQNAAKEDYKVEI